MKNRIVKQLLLVTIATTLAMSAPVVSWAADTKKEENNIDTEKESVYQEALKMVTDSFDYTQAEELLKDIEGYKDSDELIDRYERMKTTRFIDGRFYWQPQEYVQVLKQNLLALEDDYTNIEITNGTTTPEDGTTDTITISYEDGTTEVLLQNIKFDSNDNANSFGKVKVQGVQGGILTYPVIVVMATIAENHSVDSAKELLSKLIDLNPHGEFSQDGFKYTFNNDGTTMSFEIEPDGETTTDKSNIQDEETPAAQPVVEYKDATTIRIVQQTLNNAGYNCGNPDGVAGGKTTESIKRYQTDKGITVNGLVTDELLQSLNIVDQVQEAVKGSNDSISGEEGVKTVFSRLSEYDGVQVSDPIEEKGALGYVVLFKDNRYSCIVNPDNNGKISIGIMPQEQSRSTVSSDDYFEIVGDLMQSFDTTLSSYEAYDTIANTINKKSYSLNGYEYSFDEGLLSIIITH